MPAAAWLPPRLGQASTSTVDRNAPKAGLAAPASSACQKAPGARHGSQTQCPQTAGGRAEVAHREGSRRCWAARECGPRRRGRRRRRRRRRAGGRRRRQWCRASRWEENGRCQLRRMGSDEHVLAGLVLLVAATRVLWVSPEGGLDFLEGPAACLPKEEERESPDQGVNPCRSPMHNRVSRPSCTERKRLLGTGAKARGASILLVPRAPASAPK